MSASDSRLINTLRATGSEISASGSVLSPADAAALARREAEDDMNAALVESNQQAQDLRVQFDQWLGSQNQALLDTPITGLQGGGSTTICAQIEQYYFNPAYGEKGCDLMMIDFAKNVTPGVAATGSAIFSASHYASHNLAQSAFSHFKEPFSSQRMQGDDFPQLLWEHGDPQGDRAPIGGVRRALQVAGVADEALDEIEKRNFGKVLENRKPMIFIEAVRAPTEGGFSQTEVSRKLANGGTEPAK